MIGENLDTSADDERHEEKVQEVLHPQPRWETRGDGRRGWRHAGVPHEEILHRGQLPQRLSYGHTDDDQHKTNGQAPQHVDPALANPDLGYHTDLGRQPVVQENTVVRRAEARLDGIVREWSRVSACHTAHFFGLALRFWPLAMMASSASDLSLRSAKKETPRELPCGEEPLTISMKGDLTAGSGRHRTDIVYAEHQ